MLIANQLCERNALRLGDFQAKRKISGGCIDTGVEGIDREADKASSPTEVTMTTPIVNDPSTLRTFRGSKVCKEGAGLATTVTPLHSVARLPS